MSFSRRELIASAVALPLAAQQQIRPGDSEGGGGHLKIVVAGGHPGDPECGCAGTITRYTALGHEAVLLYLNRGEGFCGGNELSHCGTIRTAEAQKACEILKARPVFAGQYDGRAVVDPAHYDEFKRLLESEKPDIVFTQWPIDNHRDHRAVSALVLDAWLAGGKHFALYFYEVADDTMMFSPTEFVDISSVEATRRAACFAHASQRPEGWYAKQVVLTQARGTDAGFGQAEAFVRHWESKRGFLP